MESELIDLVDFNLELPLSIDFFEYWVPYINLIKMSLDLAIFCWKLISWLLIVVNISRVK